MELKVGHKYKVQIKARPEYRGRKIKDGLEKYQGVITVASPQWIYEEGEKYPDEYCCVICEKNLIQELKKIGVDAMASGDLEFIDEIIDR